MRLNHFGHALNHNFGALTILHTHNSADNYSPEIVKMRSNWVGAEYKDYKENIDMPTLQQMHRYTAASPCSTARFFLLMEELSYRHLYRADRANLGNFKIASCMGYLDREDDFASTGCRGLADFVTAVFKCIESQARGVRSWSRKGSQRARCD